MISPKKIKKSIKTRKKSRRKPQKSLKVKPQTSKSRSKLTESRTPKARKTSTLNSSGKSTPKDIVLYTQVKKEADEIYERNSAYKSGWIVKTYKSRGGSYNSSSEKPLARWFAEKWVDINKKKNGVYRPCGRSSKEKGAYPLCRPSIRVSAKTPRTVHELTRIVIQRAKNQKSRGLKASLTKST